MSQIGSTPVAWTPSALVLAQTLELLYPVGDLIHIVENNPQDIEVWSHSWWFIDALIVCLPFGRVIYQREFDSYLDLFSDHLRDESLNQLCYLHLSNTADALGRPVDFVHLVTNEDTFWPNKVAPHQEHVHDQLVRGNRVHFLDSFRLDHEKIELRFSEIRSVPNNNDYRLVECDGREYTYSFERQTWSTSLLNPYPDLLNPTTFSFPTRLHGTGLSFTNPDPTRIETLPEPPVPPRPEVVVIYPGTPYPIEPYYPLRQDIDNDNGRPIPLPPHQPPRPSLTIDTTPAPLIERISTPSTPSPAEEEYTPATSGVFWADRTSEPEPNYPACWCGIDLCTCVHIPTPDTPPTPDSVTLWRHGQNFLPSNNTVL